MLLALLTTASAAETLDVRFEGQGMSLQAEDLGVYPGRERIQAPGLSVAYELDPRFGVVGNWHHRRVDANLGGYDTEMIDAYDELELGVRVYPIGRRIFTPTVTVQGSTLWSRVRLDDKPNIDDDPSEVAANAWGFGGLGAVGAEIQPFPDHWRVRATVHYEVGYLYLSSLDHDPLGSRKMGGVVLRGGTGIQF
ncbi:MAG: hypothetical protein GY913_34515 [Proteobacteria bacterium]|nr:hypothetical protein [Pseudomonadota bacterium]MCP4922044.1 hypothetical protein [Pseudomonadota bacterium]